MSCTHTDQIRRDAEAEQWMHKPHVCEECIRTGDRWVHLRICKSCGHVGCCDSSKNQHATKHFLDSGHPIIQSFEPGQDWLWCYVDEIVVSS